VKADRRGFSALEALIAAAILGLALAPLLDLQRQSARESARMETMRLALVAQRSAYDILTTVNPMLEPVGARTLASGVVIEWRAAPISRTVRALGYLNTEGEFDVALYRLNVLIRKGDAPIRTFVIEQSGWRARIER